MSLNLASNPIRIKRLRQWRSMLRYTQNTFSLTSRQTNQWGKITMATYHAHWEWVLVQYMGKITMLGPHAYTCIYLRCQKLFPQLARGSFSRPKIIYRMSYTFSFLYCMYCVFIDCTYACINSRDTKLLSIRIYNIKHQKRTSYTEINSSEDRGKLMSLYILYGRQTNLNSLVSVSTEIQQY